ncbi:MAG: SDR family oxidoreductase [Anaerolineae bacterium]|nr:SDR family oxidoreductase [Anaerolineae bacterium]
MQLDKKVAVITGAGQGLGLAMAKAFVAEGAKVVIAEYNAEKGKVAAESLGTGNAVFAHTDVRDIQSVARMAETAVNSFGRLDILVNNAGLFGRTKTEDLSEEEWDRMMDTNLKGAFLCSQAVGRVMIKQGGGGCIISMSSINGLVGFPERLAYNCSKAAIDALTRVLASEWGQYNIRVNAIAPGYVRNDVLDEHIASGWFDGAAILKRTPLARFIEEDDIAKAAVYLASPAAYNVSGVVLPVDGGWVAYGYL